MENQPKDIFESQLVDRKDQGTQSERLYQPEQLNESAGMNQSEHLSERLYQPEQLMQSERLYQSNQTMNPLPVIERKHNIIYKIWRITYPAMLYLFVAVLVQFPAGILIGIVAIGESGGNADKMMEISMDLIMKYSIPMLIVGALITIPIFLWIMSKDYKKELAIHGKKIYEKIKLEQWALIVVLAICFCISLNGVITLSRIQEMFSGFDEVADAIYGGNVWIQILGVGIIAPIAEELIFRGLAYKRLEQYSNWKVAMVVSSLFFGLYHMNLVQFLYATAMGLLMAYVYHKFHTIWAPIVFHCVANIISVLLVNVAFLSNLWVLPYFEIIITVTTGVAGFIIWKMLTKIKAFSVVDEPSLMEEQHKNNY